MMFLGIVLWQANRRNFTITFEYGLDILFLGIPRDVSDKEFARFDTAYVSMYGKLVKLDLHWIGPFSSSLRI